MRSRGRDFIVREEPHRHGVDPVPGTAILPLSDVEVHVVAGERDRITRLLLDGEDARSADVAGLELRLHRAVD